MTTPIEWLEQGKEIIERDQQEALARNARRMEDKKAKSVDDLIELGLDCE
jgi:hypothetical protein